MTSIVKFWLNCHIATSITLVQERSKKMRPEKRKTIGKGSKRRRANNRIDGDASKHTLHSLSSWCSHHISFVYHSIFFVWPAAILCRDFRAGSSSPIINTSGNNIVNDSSNCCANLRALFSSSPFFCAVHSHALVSLVCSSLILLLVVR